MAGPPLLETEELTRAYGSLLAVNRAKTPVDKLKALSAFRPTHLAPSIPENGEPRTGMSMGDHMAVTAAQMMEAAGAKNIRQFTFANRIPGFGIHEMGTARMGSDSKTSVLNQYLQAHDISNLYVMDASSFVSGGCQNPTLTIMALAVRGCNHLMAEMKRGNI